MRIGDLVKVRGVAIRDYIFDDLIKHHTHVIWMTKVIPVQFAVITGKTTRYDGKYEPSYLEEPEPGYLKITKTHTLWLVRFSLTTKEVPVFENEITLANNVIHMLPYRRQYQR